MWELCFPSVIRVVQTILPSLMLVPQCVRVHTPVVEPIIFLDLAHSLLQQIIEIFQY